VDHQCIVGPCRTRPQSLELANVYPLYEHLDFHGRRILITGGSRGIGREIAHLLAELGAAVVVVARSHVDVDQGVAELPGEGHLALALDVGDSDGWVTAADSGALQGIDGLVTAAAVLAPVGPIGSYAPDEFWATMRVNVLGTLLAVHHCMDSLEARRGAVVTFAGGGATYPQPRYDAYATSKAAVVRLSENLALELAERGVRVNAVSPGFVATDMHTVTLDAGPELAGKGYFENTERRLDTGGVSPRRAAELAAFLLSELAHGITGRLISAPWDPWEKPAFQQRLREEPDLATIRRIDDHSFASVQASLSRLGVEDSIAKHQEVDQGDEHGAGQVDHLRGEPQRGGQQ
jgi:NAD(P)-dependent dehydrogenase (short-subunit alcohol dehydrogenase family)